MNANWRCADSLGKNDDPDWTIWEGRKKIDIGYAACQSRAIKWDPLQSLSVGRPGEVNLLPLVSVPELNAVATNAYMRRILNGIFVYGALFVTLIIASFFVHKPEVLYISTSTIAILLMIVGADYYIFSKYSDSLAERARFICWLRHNSNARNGFLFFIAVLSCLGLVQWWYAEFSKDADAPILAVGMVYKSFQNGEWWRALTGPYIHSGLAHLFANIATGALFCAILSATQGILRTAITFVISNIAAILVQYELTMETSEGMTGVSGGVFGWCGFTIGSILRNRETLPRGALTPLLGMAALSIPLSLVTGSKIAIHAHWGGFMAGLVLGVLLTKKRVHGKCIQGPSKVDADKNSKNTVSQSNLDI